LTADGEIDAGGIARLRSPCRRLVAKTTGTMGSPREQPCLAS
jgi:hypothetical protein